MCLNIRYDRVKSFGVETKKKKGIGMLEGVNTEVPVFFKSGSVDLASTDNE
jgi:hypothetical protein